MKALNHTELEFVEWFMQTYPGEGFRIIRGAGLYILRNSGARITYAEYYAHYKLALR